MASLHQHRSNYDRVFFASAYSDAPRRGSTSQMCLHKILSIITTASRPLAAATKESSAENDASGKRSGFDLNTEFSVSQEMNKETDSSWLSSSSTTAGDGSGTANDCGCFDVCDRVEKEEKSLALLIEAAELIFGEFKESDKSESSETQNIDSEVKKDEAAADIETNGRELRRRSTWWAAAEEMGREFEETPPSSTVVRSKRGRTQVLPGKYRDSVLEPLTRLSRTRPSILPPKRRRR